MNRDFENALDQCLAWMREGMGLEACLARYPEYTGELRPLLEMIPQVVRALPPVPPAAAREAGQQRMLAALASRTASQAQTPLALRHLWLWLRSLAPGRPGSRRPAWHTVALTLAVLLVATIGATAVASAASLPGDAFYPVKLAGQNLQLALTWKPDRQQALQDRFTAQRRSDVQAVLETGRRATVDFEGFLQEMDTTRWIVSGLSITVQDATVVTGQPYLGAQVHVRGSLPGDGSLVAVEIHVESTLVPTATESPEPSATDQATPTLQPTGTPAPSKTAQLAPTSAPTSTPQPTATPSASETPESEGATSTPQQTKEVTPSTSDGDSEPATGEELGATPEPGETPVDDGELEDDHESEHDGTPTPTEEPESEDDESEHDGTPTPTVEPESGDDHESEHDGTPTPTEEPESEDEHEENTTPEPTGLPDQEQTPAPIGRTSERFDCAALPCPTPTPDQGPSR